MISPKIEKRIGQFVIFGKSIDINILIEPIKSITPIDLIKPVGPIDLFSVSKLKLLVKLALTKVCILIISIFLYCMSLMAFKNKH